MSFGRRRTGREDGLGRSARPSQAREHIRDLVLIAPAEQQEKRPYSGGKQRRFNRSRSTIFPRSNLTLLGER
jgi:hypothetical protein